MSKNTLAETPALSFESRALLRAYDMMREEWAERFESGGIAASRAFADAVFDRFRGPERDLAPGQSIDLTVPGGGGERPARLYKPETTGNAPTPLALFLHGGGWSLGGIPAYDGLVGSLAALSGVAILSLDYRLAPEHPFPMGLDDARQALDWLHHYGPTIGGDPNRLAVIGDSAGGNLAAVLARKSALGESPPITCQVLIYPMTDVASPSADFPSRARFGDGRFFLIETAIEFARDGYLAGTSVAADDPRVSPLLAPVPPGLPNALIVTAGHDPLLDEAVAYHERLRAAGIDCIHQSFDDTIHALVSFGVLDQAQAARRLVADYLRQRMEP